MAANAGKKRMTTPVKPPIGNMPLQSVEELNEIVQGQQPTAVTQQINEASQAASTSPPPPARIETVEQIIDGLKAGAIDVDRAVMLIVEQTLERSAALGNAAVTSRKDLADLLRSALKEDPALVALVNDLRNASQ
jgi:hypothetical protein